jgi:hypothetical protein
MSPYRTDEAIDRSDEEAECPSGDLLPVIVVVWLGSVVRVAGALLRAERFGSEATLAFLAIVLLPFLCADAAAWWLRRRRARSGS